MHPPACHGARSSGHKNPGARFSRTGVWVMRPAQSDRSDLSDKSGRDVSSYASCLNFSVPLSSVNFQFAQAVSPPTAVS